MRIISLAWRLGNGLLTSSSGALSLIRMYHSCFPSCTYGSFIYCFFTIWPTSCFKQFGWKRSVRFDLIWTIFSIFCHKKNRPIPTTAGVFPVEILTQTTGNRIKSVRFRGEFIPSLWELLLFRCTALPKSSLPYSACEKLLVQFGRRDTCGVSHNRSGMANWEFSECSLGYY